MRSHSNLTAHEKEAGQEFRPAFSLCIRFELPENDPYFEFEFELADALPETLEAKQSAVVAYRDIGIIVQ